MAKYSKKAQGYVKRAMRKKKKGTLRSGSGKKVTSRKQAIAIGSARKGSESAQEKEYKKENRKENNEEEVQTIGLEIGWDKFRK